MPTIPEERHERVGVVAEDHGPISGKHVHEMRVAVIRHVKNVEITGAPPKPAREVPEPIDHAIHGARLGVGVAAQPAHKRRAEWLDGHRAAGHARNVPLEHVGHEIHARPVLLAQVRDEADPQGTVLGRPGLPHVSGARERRP